MRTLRSRLFLAILGAVLLAVGVSLAVGILLTGDAARDAIESNLEREVETRAAALEGIPDADRGDLLFQLPVPPPGGPPMDGLAPEPGEPGEEVPAPGPERLLPGALPPVLALEDAGTFLPGDAVAQLEAGEPASGTVVVDGAEQIYEARAVGDTVALASRPDPGGDDVRDYLSALFIASGIALLLAAVIAALIARRLTQPIGRVADASRVLATGGSPDPVPRESTTELAALADAFNEMATQLDRAREAERSVLLSVSHDLRTPLTAIQGYAEGIEDGTLEPGPAAVVLSRESKRLERLVDDLLALAKLRQGILEVRSEPVDLAEVLAEAEERLRPQAEAASVALVLDLDGPAQAVGDHDRVLQVATNLIENAVRVTPAGGRVTATVRGNEFTIADTGPGIPAEELPRAFERFHLRDRLGRGSGGGAGLGLAIVRELTEAMGGEVSVTSPPGEGARFTVRLPR
jgi:signal transduction histidine kinase